MAETRGLVERVKLDPSFQDGYWVYIGPSERLKDSAHKRSETGRYLLMQWRRSSVVGRGP